MNTPSLDDKKDVIVKILQDLRMLNPAIGNYDKSIMNSEFNYSVKLNNGKIELPDNLIQDYEAVGSADINRLRNISQNFISNLAQQQSVPQSPISSLQPAPTYTPPQKNKSDKNPALRIVLISLVVIVVGVIGYLFYNEYSQQQKFRDDIAKKTLIRNNIASWVTASRSGFTYSNMGGVSGLKVTITNNCDYILDMVRVRVDYIKNGGGIWDTKYVDFNNVSANSAQTLPAPDSYRGTSVDYQIVSIKSAELGL